MTKTIINVTDFGAVADGTSDCAEAIQLAVAACHDASASEPVLVFPKGIYRVDSAKLAPHGRVASFSGISGLAVEGNGSTLLYSGNATPFYFEHCRELVIRDLKVDWVTPPFSQGTVTAIDEAARSMTIAIDAGYPLSLGLEGSGKIDAMMDYDPESGLPLANLDIFGSGLSHVEMVGPGLVRLTLKPRQEANKAEHLATWLGRSLGKRMVLRHAVYGCYAIDLMYCSDIRIEDVKIYTCPGMGIHAQECADITTRRVEVRIRPGSGRLMSTTADCQYYTYCSGTISIEDGYYEGMGDDGLNITAKYRLVKSRPAPDTIAGVLPTPRGWPGALPIPGERLIFQSGADLHELGTGEVRSASWNAAAKCFDITFTEPLPAAVQDGDLFYSATYLPRVEIRRCTFRGMRSRGVLLSTRQALVEDCQFEGMGYSGILLKGGLRHGAEGPTIQDITVRDCVFEGCGGAGIYAYSDSVQRPAGALRGLTIERNIFRDVPALTAQRFKSLHPRWMHWNAAICVLSVDGLRVADNRFEGIPGATAIFLRNNTDVEVRGNVSESDGGAEVGIHTDADDVEADLNYVCDLR